MKTQSLVSTLIFGSMLLVSCVPPDGAAGTIDAASTDLGLITVGDTGGGGPDAGAQDAPGDAGATDLLQPDSAVADVSQADDAATGADLAAADAAAGVDAHSGQACELPLPEDVEPDPQANLPFGFLDAPLLVSAISGRVLFSGWVLAAVGVERVELHIDGAYFKTLELWRDRPDVCAAFPSPPCEPGFYEVIDLYDLSECDHLAEIWGTDTAGNSALIDRALLRVTRPPRGYRLGERELVHRVDDPRITQALDMIVDDSDHVIACFGSWHTPGNNYDSHCRDLMSGAEERGHGQHETAGVGLDQGSAGVLIGFEADDARVHGGPGLFGSGLAHDDGGTHFWQAVSVGHGFAIAAAARIDGLNVDVYLGENDGAGPWSMLATSGLGVAHRQLFLDPHHLIFTTRYQDAGTPRLIRVDAQRAISTVTYSGLPSDCEGVGTAALIPNVGLVAGTYSDQLPWRGGSCGAIGLLDADTGNTSDWVSLGAADVIDIVPIGDEGYFAASVNFASRVVLLDPELRVTDQLPLIGPQVGGLAYLDGSLYAASAGPGIGAYVFRFPLVFNDQGPAPVVDPSPGDERELCLIWKQTEQSCSSCGIWFDWQDQQANKARLEIEYTLNGQQQTRSYQHGDPGAGDAMSVTIRPGGATMWHSMLIKQTPANHALFWADISDIDPAARIDRATLHLHIESDEGLANSDNTSVIQAHECGHAWHWDHVTWTQADLGQAWATPGGDYGPLVRQISAGDDMHDLGYNKVNNNIPFDFTSHVQDLFAR